jgi:hypothetical protein
MEATVSMAAASILVVGVGSTVYVASRGTSEGDRSSPVVNGSIAIEQIAAELQYAVNFSERSPTAVEFTVADRDGDASSETIRYEWSGEAGDPLVRSYNGVAQSLVEDVHAFDLGFRLQTVTATTTSEGGSSESSETLLASFTGWAGITPMEQARSVTTSSWSAEYFEPAWPEGADSLKVTRVRLLMAKSTGTADYSVGIHRAAGGTGPQPELTAIGTPQTVSGVGLSTAFEWQEIPFNDVTLSSDTDGYVIVVKGVTTGARVQYLLSTTAPADASVHVYTTSAGSVWSPSASQQTWYDVPFYVYGTYTTSTPVETSVDRHFIRSVGVGLQVSDEGSARIDTSAEILNAPEVAGS